MSRRNQGVLLGMQNIQPLPDPATEEEIVDRMDLVHTLLVEAGYTVGVNPGTGRVTDPEWGGDIGEFVLRSMPHERSDGLGGTTTVSLKLDTLKATIDGDGAIVAWGYTED